MQKYSVLMSIYNEERPEYLKESLESLVNQTILPDEIVIVEDGPISRDLKQVVSYFSTTYSELFKIVTLNNNVGLGKALDIGMQYCKNELIARMDSDDICLPQRCEKQLKRFESNSDLMLLGTMIDEFYENPEMIVSSRIVPTRYEEIKRFMKRRSPFNHPTVMYKKTAVIEAGGYGVMKRKQDLDLFSRMINKGYYAENLSESLLLFRSNLDNFKRRKSWSYCKSYIEVQYQIFKRGHCNIIDLLYVLIAQMIIFFVPYNIWVILSNRVLRENKKR